MVVPRSIPLDPDPEFDVFFVPELGRDLLYNENMDELVLELEAKLALRFEHIAGKRIETIAGSKSPTLYKYRPHTDNALRVIFASEDDERRRIILDCWPRKQDYRRQDLATAALRFRRFLESTNTQ